MQIYLVNFLEGSEFNILNISSYRVTYKQPDFDEKHIFITFIHGNNDKYHKMLQEKKHLPNTKNHKN